MSDNKEESNKIVFGYWKIQGLATSVRLLLHYKEVAFEDVLYEVGPNMDLSSWTDVKHKLHLDFPNLPYLLDGDSIKITQSCAIMRHLARKYNLTGSTVQEQALADMMADQCVDVRSPFSSLCYSSEFESKKDKYMIETMPKWLKSLDDYLGNSRHFVAGDQITYADLMWYATLEAHMQFAEDTIKQYPNVVAYHHRIESLPTIAKYIQSEEYQQLPLNNKMASFGQVITERVTKKRRLN